MIDSTTTLDSIKTEELPDELKALSKDEQFKVVEEMKVKRVQEIKKLDEFVKKRTSLFERKKQKQQAKNRLATRL